jgi:hypothetical protein
MTAQEVVELACKHYNSPLVAGENLMVFHIGREGVRVTQ